MEMETPKQRCRRMVRINLLMILTMIGAAIGFIIGFGVRTLKPSKDALMWLGIIGDMYLRSMKIMILPLIISSVITGTSSLNPKSGGKIGVVILTYIILTNFLGAILGCLMGVAVSPGTSFSSESHKSGINSVTLQSQDIFADLLRNLFPENLIQAAFQKSHTKYKLEDVWRNVSVNGTYMTKLFREITEKQVGSVDSTNVLGLIIASSLFGIAVGALKEGGEPFRKFFSSTSDIIMQILKWIVWTTPIGVASLISNAIAGTSDVTGDFRKLGVYCLTVTVTLCFKSLVLLPTAYIIIMRSNPFRFLLTILQPTMVVFATSSTAMLIPQSLTVLEKNNCIDQRLTRLIVPLTATLGRSGSAVYMACSCIFISQMVLPEMDEWQVVLICILTTFSSLAIPSVPGSSLITVIILLTSLGIPAERTALLFTVEWLLDRLRSMSNYTVQCFGSVVTFQVCKSSLPRNLGDSTGIKYVNNSQKDNQSQMQENDSRQLLIHQCSFDSTRV